MPRNRDDRDLFRSSDFREPDTFRKRQRPGKVRQAEAPPEIPADEGQHQCASEGWCHAATRDSEGTWHPALTPQPYCPACRGRIASCLEALPFAVVRLLAQIGERPRTGKVVRVPPGPREPIRLDVDALVREIAVVLSSWHERVAAVANLAAPDPEAAVTHPPETALAAQRVLSAHLDALLTLPREPMGRVLYRPEDAAEWAERAGDPDAEGTVRPGGEAFMLPMLDGIRAGKEILDLHRRALNILGEVRAAPETFDGVPCRSCEAMSLERAEPPSDPKIEAKHSRCSGCGDTMDKRTYDAWVAMYRRWAESTVGLTCRRCQNGDHGICKWQACPCRASGHVVAE